MLRYTVEAVNITTLIRRVRCLGAFVQHLYIHLRQTISLFNFLSYTNTYLLHSSTCRVKTVASSAIPRPSGQRPLRSLRFLRCCHTLCCINYDSSAIELKSVAYVHPPSCSTPFRSRFVSHRAWINTQGKARKAERSQTSVGLLF